MWDGKDYITKVFKKSYINPLKINSDFLTDGESAVMFEVNHE